MERLEEAVQIVDRMLTQRPAEVGTRIAERGTDLLDSDFRDPQGRPKAERGSWCSTPTFATSRATLPKSERRRRNAEQTLLIPTSAIRIPPSAELAAKKAQYGEDFDLVGTP